MSPAIMERYLDAAEKISRLAVGDTKAPVLVNRYRLHPEQWQGARVDELPWGTRGGLSVQQPLPRRRRVPDQGPAGRRRPRTASARDQRRRRARADRHGRRKRRGTRPARSAAEDRRAGARQGRSNSASPSKRARGSSASRSSSATKCATRRRCGRACAAAAPSRRCRSSRSAGRTAPRRPATRRAGDASSSAASSTSDRVRDADPARRSRAAPIGGRRRTRTSRICCRSTTKGRAEAGFDGASARARAPARQPAVPVPHRATRTGRPPAPPFRISDLELASRLSFFLWSSIPDDRAAERRRAGPAARRPPCSSAQVRRMLRDARSASLVTNFAEQWLFVRDIEAKQPDGLLFPDFDETLRAAMRTRDGSVPRQRPAREPQRPRPADRRTTRSSTSGSRGTTASRTSRAAISAA